MTYGYGILFTDSLIDVHPEIDKGVSINDVHSQAERGFVHCGQGEGDVQLRCRCAVQLSELCCCNKI